MLVLAMAGDGHTTVMDGATHIMAGDGPHMGAVVDGPGDGAVDGHIMDMVGVTVATGVDTGADIGMATTEILTHIMVTTIMVILTMEDKGAVAD